MRLKFKRNCIWYLQDFRVLRGIPVGIWFDCDDEGDYLRIIAPGHGGKPYGNGAIFVSKSDLSAKDAAETLLEIPV
jgi:hypothetical protein